MILKTYSKSNSTARSQDGESSAAKQIWVLHMYIYIYLYNTKTANSKKKKTELTSDREGNRTNNNSYNCSKKQ